MDAFDRVEEELTPRLMALVARLSQEYPLVEFWWFLEGTRHVGGPEALTFDKKRRSVGVRAAFTTAANQKRDLRFRVQHDDSPHLFEVRVWSETDRAAAFHAKAGRGVHPMMYEPRDVRALLETANKALEVYERLADQAGALARPPSDGIPAPEPPRYLATATPAQAQAILLPALRNRLTQALDGAQVTKVWVWAGPCWWGAALDGNRGGEASLQINLREDLGAIAITLNASSPVVHHSFPREVRFGPATPEFIDEVAANLPHLFGWMFRNSLGSGSSGVGARLPGEPRPIASRPLLLGRRSTESEAQKVFEDLEGVPEQPAALEKGVGRFFNRLFSRASILCRLIVREGERLILCEARSDGRVLRGEPLPGSECLAAPSGPPRLLCKGEGSVTLCSLDGKGRTVPSWTTRCQDGETFVFLEAANKVARVRGGISRTMTPVDSILVDISLGVPGMLNWVEASEQWLSACYSLADADGDIQQSIAICEMRDILRVPKIHFPERFSRDGRVEGIAIQNSRLAVVDSTSDANCALVVWELVGEGECRHLGWLYAGDHASTPLFSPDGTLIFTLSTRGALRSYRVMSHGLDDGQMIALPPIGASPGGRPVVCPSAPFVFVCDNGGNLVAYRYDEFGRFSGPLEFPSFTEPGEPVELLAAVPVQ